MRSLRAQLLLSHILVVGLMAVVMAGAILNFFSIGQSLNATFASSLPSIVASHEMQRALYETETELIGRTDVPVSTERLRRGMEDFERSLNRAQNNIISATKVQGEAVSLLEKIRLTFDEGSRDLQNGDLRAFSASLNRLEADSQTLFELSQRAVNEANEATRAKAQGAFIRSVLVTFGAVFVAALLAIRLMRLALTPLAMIAKHADLIATGDLSQHIELSRKDEVGHLADSFNTMAARLAEMHRSENRRLRRAQLMSDVALECLFDPVVVTDAKGRIRSLNRAAEGLFGPVPESPRKPISEHIQDHRIVRAIERSISSEQTVANEDEQSLVKLQVGSSVRTYRIRATPMKDDDDNLLGSVLVLEDITHLKVLDQMKTDFIAVASHELRTPVTSLQLSTQLLEEGAGGPLTVSQQEIVRTQREDLDRLQRLMSDLLEISKLEAGSTPPRFELVSVESLVESTMHDFNLVAADRRITLDSEIEADVPMIRIDRVQMGRVMANLVSNALRHTHPLGAVHIRVHQDHGNVSIAVEDTGEGIPEEFLTQIFDRFVQVPGAAQGGAGLGLAIVQSIVKAHGGNISVHSEVGRGSVFMITLPISKDVLREGAV